MARPTGLIPQTTKTHCWTDESGAPEYSDDSDVFTVASALARDPTLARQTIEHVRDVIREDPSQDDCQLFLHATANSRTVRKLVFEALGGLTRDDVRVDLTNMTKPNAFGYVRERGPTWLFKYTHYLHWRNLSEDLVAPGQDLLVNMSKLPRRKKGAIKHALDDVFSQCPVSVHVRQVDAREDVMLTIPDYVAWAHRRARTHGQTQHWDQVSHLVATDFWPWRRPNE